MGIVLMDRVHPTTSNRGCIPDFAEDKTPFGSPRERVAMANTKENEKQKQHRMGMPQLAIGLKDRHLAYLPLQRSSCSGFLLYRP